MHTQPQLLPLALNPRDVVYTPDDVARDVVNFFKPSGRILEPSAGDGAFLRHLPPHTEWCEIEKGRDFFAEHRHFDWIVGNPPFSIFTEWLEHSFEIADNIVYVQVLSSIFISVERLKQIQRFGGIRTIYVLGEGKPLGFPFGFGIAAFHFQRNYRGGTFTVFRENT